MSPPTRTSETVAAVAVAESRSGGGGGEQPRRTRRMRRRKAGRAARTFPMKPLFTCLSRSQHRVHLTGALVVLLVYLFAPPDTDFRLIPPGASAFFIDSRQSPQTHEWSYEHQSSWPKQYKTCHMKAQSPIDIQHKNVITSSQLKLNFFNYNRPIKFSLQNAHHTIKMDPLGWAYRRSLDHSFGGGGGASVAAISGGGPKSQMHLSANSNNNNISHHDMITADEYVEFATESLSSSNSNNNDNEQLSKLSVSSSAANEINGGGAGRTRVISSNNNSNSKQQPADQAFQFINSNDGGENDQNLPYAGAPTIKLDWLDDGNNEYKLRDIHFHWGERRDNGSEHAIDGRRAAMEMHLVHIKHGLDKSKIGFTSDSVAVIAVLIESHRKSNADFNPIVNVLSRINTTEEAQEIDYKSINDLLPSNLNSFYTYSGSLTTPPCYQVVNWIVMTERLNMNAKQIEMFRNIYSSADPSNQHNHNHHHHDEDHEDHSSSTPPHHRPQLMVPNVRSLQPLNNRTILASFYKSGIGRLDSSIYSSSSASIHDHHRHNKLISGNIISIIVVISTTINSFWCWLIPTLTTYALTTSMTFIRTQ